MSIRLAALALCAALGPGAACLAQPVSSGATVPPVETRPLDAPDPAAVGLLSQRQTGLPRTLWQQSDVGTLVDLIIAVDPAVPALRDLLVTLMLAEADPPPVDGVRLLAARLDRLRRMGAVDEALAILDIAGHEAPGLFQIWTDLSLLTGQTDALCARLSRHPTLSPDLDLRIYCLARSGAWDRAALTFRTAQALGAIGPRMAGLLALYLDPEAGGQADLTPPLRPSPLEVRLYEAIGEALPTAPLPLPFAVQDLGGDNGWRAQILAAERLARGGTLPANRLLGLYSLRRAAASGGVWDRVAALQAFEEALESGRPDTVSEALRRVWPQMASAGLLVPFAELFGEPLSKVALTGRAERLALFALALSPAYETLPATSAQAPKTTAFLQAIARGTQPSAVPDLPHAPAVAAALDGAAIPDRLAQTIQNGQLGEALLRAIALFSSGADGNGIDLTDALTTLRGVGLEDTARRAALQLVIHDLERARR